MGKWKVVDLFPDPGHKLETLENDGYNIFAIQNNMIIAKYREE